MPNQFETNCDSCLHMIVTSGAAIVYNRAAVPSKATLYIVAVGAGSSTLGGPDKLKISMTAPLNFSSSAFSAFAGR